jgi:MSHA biogenesis protein MshG
MGEFLYKGRSATGEAISGRLAGNSSDAVANRLINMNVIPVDIAEAAERSEMTVEDFWRRLGGGRPTTKDLGLFCRQMHVITRTGLPLLRGIGGLAETTHNEVLRAALLDVMASLESGRGLAQSMGDHTDIFPPLFISIIEMGETTGTVDTAFERMYEYLTMEQEIRDRVKDPRPGQVGHPLSHDGYSSDICSVRDHYRIRDSVLRAVIQGTGRPGALADQAHYWHLQFHY